MLKHIYTLVTRGPVGEDTYNAGTDSGIHVIGLNGVSCKPEDKSLKNQNIVEQKGSPVIIHSHGPFRTCGETP